MAIENQLDVKGVSPERYEQIMQYIRKKRAIKKTKTRLSAICLIAWFVFLLVIIITKIL